jgi:hypothetical protein
MTSPGLRLQEGGAVAPPLTSYLRNGVNTPFGKALHPWVLQPWTHVKAGVQLHVSISV